VRGLVGKVALVTGGSSGLGEAVVLRLAEEGVHVAVGGRNRERAGAVAAAAVKCAQRAGHAIETSLALGDVSVVAECEQIVGETVERHRGLDILVNSAGIWLEKPILDTTEEEWDSCIDTGLKGTYFMCRAALRHMLARRSGVIVNIASDSGITTSGRMPIPASRSTHCRSVARATIATPTASPSPADTANCKSSTGASS